VKINEIKSKVILFTYLPIEYFSLLPKFSQPVVIKYYSIFSLIFMQDSGNNQLARSVCKKEH